MINVTVIGFGNVGSVLSVMLLNAFEGIRFNIIDPNPQREGAFLDLVHSMPLYKDRELHFNGERLLRDADFVFYTAGIPNKHGGSRLSTAKQNIELTEKIFKGQKFEREPYVIVITNPVDMVTHYVNEFTDLPVNNVLGTGTLLDSVRLSYYLSRLTETHPNDYNSMVLGEHGDSQFAVYSHSYYKQDLIQDWPDFTPSLLKEAEDLTRNAAFQIRETQKGTTYGVAKCAVKIMDDLLDTEEHMYPLSVLTTPHYMDLLQLEKPIHISVPVSVSSKGVRVIEDIEYSMKELNAYRISAQILSDIMV